jgi:RHS repeat-associated protein
MEYSDYYPDGMRFESSTSNSAALPYRYNGKELEAMNGLNEYDYGARRRETGIPIWTTMDPLCEKYYAISPYTYCSDDPAKNIDPDGKDWKKLSDWIKFAKTVYKATTAMITVGFQGAVEAKVASKPIGVNLNAASIDIIGERNGKFTPNKNTPQVKKEAEAGVGIIGGSYTKSVTDNGKTSTVEEKISVGTAFSQVEHKTTTEVTQTADGNYQKGASVSKTTVKVPDIQVKVAAIVGIEVGVDPNKIWNAFSHLINDK